MRLEDSLIEVAIRWDDSREMVALDLAKLRRGEPFRIQTRERWDGGKTELEYRPMAKYQGLSNGTYNIELRYVRSEHPHLVNTAGILWGRAIIKVAKSLRRAEAFWFTSPKDPDQDGGPAACRIRVLPLATARELQATSKIKRSQQAFKNRLRRLKVNTCEISGEQTLAVLDAAHVLDVEQGGPDLPNNGLLLRADLHRLFDAGYFSILTTGKLRLHRALPKRYAAELKGYKVSDSTLLRIAPYLHRRHARTPQLG
jgi:hypothetical protein